MAIIADLDIGRQHLLGGRFQHLQRLAQRNAGSWCALDGDGAQAIQTVETLRPGHLCQRDKVGQRHQFAVGGNIAQRDTAAGAHEDILQILRAIAIFGTGLHNHRIFDAAIHILRDLALTKHQLYRAPDGFHRNAQISGTRTIDAHTQIRLRFPKIAVQIEDLARSLGLLDQQVAPVLDGLVIWPAEHELHGLVGGTALPERGRIDGEDAGSGDGLQTPKQFALHLHLANAAQFPFLQPDNDQSGIDRSGPLEARRNDAQGGIDNAAVRIGFENLLHLLHPVPRVGKARPLRGREGDEDRGAIFRWGKFLLDRREEAIGHEADQGTNHQHDDGHGQCQAQHPPIDRIHANEDRLTPTMDKPVMRR